MKLKKVMAAVLIGLMVFSMAACGDSGKSTKEDTITIMVPPVTGTYVEDLQGWIEEYRKDHPNITVEVIATSWDEHTNKLSTMALAGEAPDIAEVSYGAVGTYVEMGVGVNIADYMSKERLADYDQNALDYMTMDNTLYGLPLYITIQALGGNREMLEAAGADVQKIQTQGWTYEEFLEIIKNGTKEGCFGFVFANSGATTADFVSIFGVAAGISSNFTQDLKYVYTSENMLSLLQAVETMTSSGYMPNYSVEAGQRLVMLETGQTMLTGKAMPLFESNVKKNIAGKADGSAVEGTIDMEYVFLPVPTMSNATESVYGVVDGLIALRNNNTTEEHLKNVCEFMDFLSSGERAAAVERAITKVIAPPAGITAEMNANAKTMMDETIVPKFQALLAGETTAQEVYDAICKDAKNLFGEENCASGWIQ